MALAFKAPYVIKATYRIVTPMFIGDAEQKASGISPASVKGALRFWWRALNWGRIHQATKGNETEALKQLHDEEGKLFGTSADNGKAARFTLRVISGNLAKTVIGTTHPEFKKQPAARYLGYGLMEAFGSKNKNTEAGQLVRECINENQTFTIQIISNIKIDESLRQALIAFGLLGGLGSRVRHGMGSITLESLQENDKATWVAPKNQENYITTIQQLLKPSSETPFPPFSAFSTVSKIDLLETATTPYNLLADFGKKMLLYRSWGKDGKVLDYPSERRFTDDHDWSKGQMPSNFHPKRVIFGLPHNYGKGDHLSVTPEKHRPPLPRDAYEHDRRASPLFFHVHQIGSQYVGVSLLLPADFLPHGEKINAGGTNVPAKIEWSVLTDFLEGKDKQENMRFQNKKTVIKGRAI